MATGILDAGASARRWYLWTFLPSLLIAVAWTVSAAPALAQNLSVDNVTGMAGDTVDVSVGFSSGSTGVSTLQFDLTTSGSLSYVSTSTGAAAGSAGKTAQGSPISGGVRILIFGLNQSVIGSGHIATVRLAIASNAQPATLPIGIGGIVAADPNGSPVGVGGNGGSVTVTQPSIDTTPPTIDGVTSSNITASSAVITWRSNEPADSLVEYGTTNAYGKSTPLSTDLTTSHVQVLSGLSANTQYHYRVRSKDGAGNSAVSGSYTFTTTTVAGGPIQLTLSYPRIINAEPGLLRLGESEYTGVAIANLDTGTATISFTAFDPSGVQLSGAGVTNPATRTLRPGEQLPIIDAELFGPGLSGENPLGWVRIESPVSKLTGFFLMFDSSLTFLDGGNVLSNPSTRFVLPEIEEEGLTRVHLSNPGTEPVTLTIHLLRSDGTVRSSVERNVRGKGALVADVFADLFPGFNPSASDYIRVASSGGVLPTMFLSRPSRSLRVLAGQDEGQGARTLYCPQFVTGGSWRSKLSVVNLDNVPGSVTFRYFSDKGEPIGESKILAIAAQGKIHVDDPRFFVDVGDAVLQGYVEISSSLNLSGSVTFGDRAQDGFASALPLVAKLGRSIVFSHIASNDVYFTGVAILNPNDAPATATVDVYSADGRLEFRATEIIPARQRRSRLLTEYFPTMTGQNRTSGYVRVNVDRDVASFSLFGTDNLTFLSAIPAQTVP